MARITDHGGLNDILTTGWAALSRLAGGVYRRVRRPLLIVIGAVVIGMLLIVVLQSGLGVDSDVTITDSHRPEIVGGE